jgi:signal transduction histidine kinase
VGDSLTIPGFVALHVRDTGIGIPADKLVEIFEPFVQVYDPKVVDERGTGLGLSISRDLARKMGGDLSAASILGEGAVFSVSLPRASS